MLVQIKAFILVKMHNCFSYLYIIFGILLGDVWKVAFGWTFVQIHAVNEEFNF